MNWMPKSILVIDDEESTLITLKDAFRNYPANFSFARSGAEGLALAASSHPDLIILDVNMPLMNGYEVLDELKKNTLTASLPVVMNSSLRLTLDDFSGKLNRPDLILQKDRLSVGQGFRPILQLLNWEKGE